MAGLTCAPTKSSDIFGKESLRADEGVSAADRDDAGKNHFAAPLVDDILLSCAGNPAEPRMFDKRPCSSARSGVNADAR